MAQNFISYHNLDFDDARLFYGFDLHQYLTKAWRVLFKDFAFPGFVKFEDLNFNEVLLTSINQRIADVLEIVGRNTNSRYTRPGMTLDELLNAQHQFFLGSSARETFSGHLMASMLLEKTNHFKATTGTSPEDKVRIANAKFLEANSDQKDLKSTLKDLRGGDRYTYGKSKMTEMEMRAVGVFYLVDLVWLSAKEALSCSANPSRSPTALTTLLRSSHGLFVLLNALDEYLSRSLGGKESNPGSNHLHDILDEVARNNLDKTDKEIIFLASEECRRHGVSFYKEESAPRKRIRVIRNSR